VSVNTQSYKLPEKLAGAVTAAIEDWKKNDQGQASVVQGRFHLDRSRRRQMARLAVRYRRADCNIAARRISLKN